MCLQLKTFENTLGKGETAHYEPFLHFPVFSKDSYCRHVKTWVSLGKLRIVPPNDPVFKTWTKRARSTENIPDKAREKCCQLNCDILLSF